jgi:hypothetical protein
MRLLPGSATFGDMRVGPTQERLEPSARYAVARGEDGHTVKPSTAFFRGGYKTAYHDRKRQQAYRDKMREQKLCINGASHGLATHGCRCERCYNVHSRSAG